MPNSEIKLTPAQLRVLHAIAAGIVSRSESIGSLYKTHFEGRNVDRQINALRAHGLIHLGDMAPTGRLRRPWLLTGDGRHFINELGQGDTRPNSSQVDGGEPRD